MQVRLACQLFVDWSIIVSFAQGSCDTGVKQRTTAASSREIISTMLSSYTPLRPSVEDANSDFQLLPGNAVKTTSPSIIAPDHQESWCV